MEKSVGVKKKSLTKKSRTKGGKQGSQAKSTQYIEPSRDVSAVYASQKIEKIFFNAKNDVFFFCKKTKMTEFFIFATFKL